MAPAMHLLRKALSALLGAGEPLLDTYKDWHHQTPAYRGELCWNGRAAAWTLLQLRDSSAHAIESSSF
jgi:hypothetical protein